jgi:tripartite-type tricarboxylate transporter receptor subunit TctC
MIHKLRFLGTRAAVFLSAMVVAAGLAQPASAQKSVEDFYKGKNIDLVIGYSPGGGYDLYARMVAQHIGKHIPGNPNVIPRNMPGAGSRTAVAWIANIAPKDGTALATADQSLSIAQAMGDKALTDMKIDTAKLIYIGNPSADNNTTSMWHTSKVKTIQDAMKIEAPMGATGGSTSSQYPRAMNALLGTKFKIILGYPGGNDINLAMERGEVEGRGSNAWASWKSTRMDWIKEKKINIIVQIGLTKAPDLPDVPLMMDLAKNAEDKAVLKLLSAPTTIGRPIFTSPGVPEERVKALRAAFEATMKDPEFLADAQKRGFDINPVSGEEMQKIVVDIVSTPRAIADRLQSIIGTE